MKNTVLAKRYAKALFMVASEEDALDAFSGNLNILADLIRATPEIGDALVNPMYPMEAKGKVMEHLIQYINASQIMANFLQLLVQKKRAGILPEIAEVFQALVNEKRNICKGKVITALALEEDLLVKVKDTLEKLTGKKVELVTEVDPSVMGGIIAKVGDLVLDGSLRTQLTDLKESIKGSM